MYMDGGPQTEQKAQMALRLVNDLYLVHSTGEENIGDRHTEAFALMLGAASVIYKSQSVSGSTLACERVHPLPYCVWGTASFFCQSSSVSTVFANM